MSNFGVAMCRITGRWCAGRRTWPENSVSRASSRWCRPISPNRWATARRATWPPKRWRSPALPATTAVSFSSSSSKWPIRTGSWSPTAPVTWPPSPFATCKWDAIMKLPSGRSTARAAAVRKWFTSPPLTKPSLKERRPSDKNPSVYHSIHNPQLSSNF